MYVLRRVGGRHRPYPIPRCRLFCSRLSCWQGVGRPSFGVFNCPRRTRMLQQVKYRSPRWSSGKPRIQLILRLWVLCLRKSFQSLNDTNCPRRLSIDRWWAPSDASQRGKKALKSSRDQSARHTITPQWGGGRKAYLQQQ